jgi:thioredoxin reductase
VRGRTWGILANTVALLEFASFVTGWASKVVAFTNGPLELPPELRARLDGAGVLLEPRRIHRLGSTADHRLRAVELADGAEVPCDAMVMRPPQRQSPLVGRLGLALDDAGYVRVSEREETSVPGIYAAGDLTTPVQGAMVAAAAGVRAAWAINHELNSTRSRHVDRNVAS